MLTKTDVKGARLVLKTSINPKEIARAQEVLRQYKEQEGGKNNEVGKDVSKKLDV